MRLKTTCKKIYSILRIRPLLPATAQSLHHIGYALLCAVYLTIFRVPLYTQTVFDLTVQPFSGTEFFADGEYIIPQVLEHDNTLARVRFIFDNPKNRLEIRHQGFRPLTLTADTLVQKNGFAFLSSESSNYDTVAVFTTGSRPKSVRFINASCIAVTLLGSNGADIIDIETGIITRISPPVEYAKQSGFVESLLLPQQNELWISQMTAACIHIFDIHTLLYKRSVQTSGTWSKVMAYNSVLNRVYVSNWVSRDISVINPVSYTEEVKIPVAAVPRGMAFSHDGAHIYCAQFEDETGKACCRLLKKELASFKTVAESGHRGAKRHIAADYRSNRLYVSDMFNACLDVYSLEDDRFITSIKVFNNPNTIVLSPDAKLLYVSCRGPNNPEKGYLYKGNVMGRLDIIDTSRLERIESIEAGNQPTGLDISPDGTIVALSDFLDNRIRLFRLRNPD